MDNTHPLPPAADHPRHDPDDGPAAAAAETPAGTAAAETPAGTAAAETPAGGAASPPPPAGTDHAAAPRRRPGRAAAALALAALLGGAAGGATSRALGEDPAAVVAADLAAARTVAPSLQLDGQAMDVAGVVAAVGPAVVSIQTEVGGRLGGTGAGTGVVLTSDGEILTNAHVVDGATSVRVTLWGESQSREAELVGSDTAADLALLRIPGAEDLPTATLGSSTDLAVGDDVVAIGNALALRGGPTVTRGIVSALDRSISTASGTMTGLVQTDASISSGNSGGPLVDAAGAVVGINTAVATSSGGSAAENIGFSIGIDQAMPVIERLRGGTTTTADDVGYLGVQVADPTDGSRGVAVVGVEDGSAADRAGIEAGDLVTRVGDRTVDGAAALAAAVQSHGAGDTVEVAIEREDEGDVTVTVTLASRPTS